jgi:hypothetical protein
MAEAFFKLCFTAALVAAPWFFVPWPLAVLMGVGPVVIFLVSFQPWFDMSGKGDNYPWPMKRK